MKAYICDFCSTVINLENEAAFIMLRTDCTFQLHRLVGAPGKDIDAGGHVCSNDCAVKAFVKWNLKTITSEKNAKVQKNSTDN